MVHLVRLQPSQNIALAPQSAIREHQHEQDRTAGAHLHVEAPEGAATVDKEDHQAALNPSRQGVHGTRDAQNVVTSPLGFGHSEDLASRSGSSRAVSSDQGTQGVHSDPTHENALEDHTNPKMDCAPHVTQVRVDMKGASAERQRHISKLTHALYSLYSKLQLITARFPVLQTCTENRQKNWPINLT